MSDAIAPPTETKRVPGTTIGNQPSGTSARSSRSRLRPGFDGAAALLHVDGEDPIHVGEAQHLAARVLRGVAVAAPETAGEHAARVRTGQPGHDIFDTARVRYRGAARGGAAPTREQLGRRAERFVTH